MALREWSTADVNEADRFVYWRDAISTAVLNVKPEVGTEVGFRGRITCSELQKIRFAWFVSSPHEIWRTRADAAQSDSEHYLLSFQRRGTSRMRQDDGCCELLPGEIGIIDGTRPFRIEFPEDVERMVVVLPHDLLDQRAPWLRRDRPVKLPDRSPFFQICCSYVNLLAKTKSVSGPEEAVLSDNLCNIISLLSGQSDSHRPASRNESHIDLALILAHVKSNLLDPTLSPANVAGSLRISIRTLHKRFEETGVTFGRWVLTERLQACARMLENPRYDRYGISEIAFSVGFNDLSHFTKSFRGLFGIPPRDFRQDSQKK
jgi:AraC family transcriptional activator of tynA and feaB